ncbi:hypothetical protein FJT64_002527 [Amphibalanus amphitrite]|uniref:Uncharacterized protein n=1 Tax=Amphibalanus amphitrite TaxID=1232801 RepID=A0A6A4WD60_AMPAM|nr:hypothetical protein FJT64_002527 [Amphibalanus amphitrite]
MVEIPDDMKEKLVAMLADEDIRAMLRGIFGVEEREREVRELKEEVAVQKAVCAELKEEMAAQRAVIQQQEVRLADLEQYSRRNCLNFTGVPEEKEENAVQLALDLAKMANMAVDYQARMAETAGGELRGFGIGEDVWARSFSGPKWRRGRIAAKTGPVSYEVDVGDTCWSRHADQLLRAGQSGRGVTPEDIAGPDRARTPLDAAMGGTLPAPAAGPSASGSAGATGSVPAAAVVAPSSGPEEAGRPPPPDSPGPAGVPARHAWSEQYRAYGSGAAAVTVDLARAPRHWGARRADTDADDYKAVQQEDFKTWSDGFRIAGRGRQAVRGCAGAHPQRPPRAVPAATGLPILLSAPTYVRSRTILIAWRRQ